MRLSNLGKNKHNTMGGITQPNTSTQNKEVINVINTNNSEIINKMNKEVIINSPSTTHESKIHSNIFLDKIENKMTDCLIIHNGKLLNLLDQPPTHNLSNLNNKLGNSIEEKNK